MAFTPLPTMSGKTTVRAAFDYSAQHADELAFKACDVIIVEDGRAVDPGWHWGRRASGDGAARTFT